MAATPADCKEQVTQVTDKIRAIGEEARIDALLMEGSLYIEMTEVEKRIFDFYLKEKYSGAWMVKLGTFQGKTLATFVPFPTIEEGAEAVKDAGGPVKGVDTHHTPNLPSTARPSPVVRSAVERKPRR